ncbi:hypothetical protein ABZ816_35425 [Actinosynnema sp. NPDC047251]|uniref:Ketohydroxyglutarate aldolase n=1 Tax=Saccharothrix espanaensis (strain ATCC 51144 / DSM 44229 / JCM 9112 / NBRC 15066 / NRRL 15764) TaxID=1179773 RepID=K0JPX2_SACES|nr:hypothetical protein [Saccharothrix espanaensis]CCH29260.1 hypothetical protein BN6_19400 [Saccharothrix espanaensis DSM 44229]
MDKVVVSVADDSLSQLTAVVAALREAGLEVDDVLEALGMVTGSIAPEALGTLKDVPGVADVERQRVLRLPPS